MRFASVVMVACVVAMSGLAQTDSRAALAADSRAVDPAAAALIARMTDATGSYEDRCAAEFDLLKLSPEAVLPALLTDAGWGMPGSESRHSRIYNSGGIEADRQAPVAWQILFAVSRSWYAQMRQVHGPAGADLAVRLLERANTDTALCRVLDAFHRAWDPPAEARVARILADARVGPTARQAAAKILIAHGAADYTDVMLKLATTVDDAENVRWYSILAQPRQARCRPPDPRVVALGFALLARERAAHPDQPDGAFLIADEIAKHTGEKFESEPREPRLQTDRGVVAETYRERAVNNALVWWEKNRARVGGEIASQSTQRRARPGEAELDNPLSFTSEADGPWTATRPATLGALRPVLRSHPHWGIFHDEIVRILATPASYPVGNRLDRAGRIGGPATDAVFPGWTFFAFHFSNFLKPGYESGQVSLAGGLGHTTAVSPGGGAKARSFHGSNYEDFGELLVTNRVRIKSARDAQQVWTAFCEIHEKPWLGYGMERVGAAEWKMGVFSYDQTVSEANGLRTIATRTHFVRVVTDPATDAVLSWASQMETPHTRVEAVK